MNRLNATAKPVPSPMTQKRLVGELRLLQKEPLELIDTYPDDQDPLLWYFLLRGPEETDYSGGFYLGKVLHNPEYPLKAPDFMMLTPSGRFEIEKKICLTNSGYHAESWSAVWNMKTILLGFLSIMVDDSTNGISHIHDSKKMRRTYVQNSIAYNMKYHRNIWLHFDRFVKLDGSVRTNEEIMARMPVVKKSSVIVNKPGVKPVNKTVDKAVDIAIGIAVDKPVDKVNDKPVDKPVDILVDIPVDKANDKPVEDLKDKPAEDLKDKPVEDLKDKPVEDLKDKPVEDLKDKPKRGRKKKIIEDDGKPAEKPVEKPKAARGRKKKIIENNVDAAKPAEKPVENSADKLTEKPIENPTENKTEKPKATRGRKKKIIENVVDTEKPVEKPKVARTKKVIPPKIKEVVPLPFNQLNQNKKIE